MSERVCAFCNGPSERKYCSSTCGYAARYRRRNSVDASRYEGRSCVICLAPLSTSKRLNAKYCSDACGNTGRTRDWRDNHPDAVIAKRVRESSDVPRRMFYRVKSRAKKAGIAFDLEVSDIVIPAVCPVLGIVLTPHEGKGYHPSSPSLDRIKPRLGYIKGNVRVISNRANLLKNDASAEELRRVLADLEVLEANHG